MKPNFYETSENVDSYIKMCLEYDGTNLYSKLNHYLQPQSTLLELGSGPGNDIEYFMSRYKVTGSDISSEFIKRCLERFPTIEFLQIDAVTINTDSYFDAIFSNKVLHHLTNEELEQSLARQYEIINNNGLIAHTFWLGEKSEEMEGLLFNYHTKEELTSLISKRFEIIESYIYKEFEDDDSILIIAKKQQ